MSFLRRFLIAVTGGVIGSLPLAALPPDSPLTPDHQFRVEIETTLLKENKTYTLVLNADQGKERIEIKADDQDVCDIIRPDLNLIYSVVDAKGMVVEIPYDAEKAKKSVPGASDIFELIGPDKMNGIDCLKYKVTNRANKISFWWINAATKLPVEAADTDGLYIIQWKNYVPGPQDPDLFEPPASYLKVPAKA